MNVGIGAWLLLVGCGTGAGGGAKGDGPARPEEETGDAADTAVVVAPEVVVRACSDGEFTTVQAAIDAAPDGATVEVCGETFSAPVAVDGRVLTIRGEEGAVLDGGGDARPLTVTANNGHTHVSLDGVTLTNGSADAGGGLACTDATLDLVDVTVTGNAAETGGGIATTNCVVRLVRTEVSANEAWSEGGGGRFEGGELWIEQSRIAANRGANGGGLLVRGAAGEVSDSVFEDNAGDVGGGIWFDAGFALTHTLFRRNVAEFTGGGFGGVDGYGAISGNVLYENYSGSDGAGGFTQSHVGPVTGNDFHDNVSSDDAGALRMLYGAALIEGNTFTANVASGGSGGAMKVSHAACDIRSNTFTDNVAVGDGGGVEVDDDVSYLTSNTFVGNRAGGRGGGLHFNEPFWNMEVDSLQFLDNVADDCGGAIAMDDDGRAESPEDRYTVTATHIDARGNRARDGGAVCVLQGGIVVENSIFADNTATAQGGAVYVAGADLALTNVTLVGNIGSAALALRSGARATITNSVVAWGDGGVITASGAFPVWRYNLHYGNGGDAFTGMADPTGENGNIDEDPSFVDRTAADYHLAAGSPGIDAGDPAIRDADGTRADLGAFGGAAGSW